MYKDAEELVGAITDRMKDLQPHQVKEDKELVRLFTLWQMYQAALEEAKQYGWIGVGCITFAENRLRSYQQLPLIHDADVRGFDEYGNYGENNPPVEGELER